MEIRGIIASSLDPLTSERVLGLFKNTSCTFLLKLLFSSQTASEQKASRAVLKAKDWIITV